MAEENNPLAIEAKKLTSHGFPIFPLKNKIAIIKYKHRRKVLATAGEIDHWFSIENGKTPRANGIAIAINDTEFGIDTDSEKCESLFLHKIVSKLSVELQEKVHKTMHTKSPRGHHRTFRYIHDDFPAGIESGTFLKLDGGHNEIALIGKDHIFIERGPGYKIINDIESLVTLQKKEVEELLKALETVKAETNGVKTIVGILLPYYTNGRRDNLVFALSGFLYKNRVPESIISEIVESLSSHTNDEEWPARLQVVKDTCNKDPKSDQVSGYNKLVEALDDSSVADIEQVLEELGLEAFSSSKRKVQHNGEFDKDHNLERMAVVNPTIDLDPYIPDRDYAEFYMHTVKKTVRKEDGFVRQVFYAALSKDSDDPLNLAVLAATSEGKSYGILQTLQYFPDKDIWYIGSMSPKVIVRQRGVLVDGEYKPLKPRLLKLKKEIRRCQQNENLDRQEQLKTELEELKESAKVLIELNGQCLVFLEPPHTETWSILKATLSHDLYEIEHPYVYDVPGLGFTVKNIVTRGWPSCIFASARNESRWDIWPEIQSRFLVISPNMIPEKVHEGNILISQKMSLPGRIQNKIIVSPTEKELAKKCAMYLVQHVKRTMTQEPDKQTNPFWIPYGLILGVGSTMGKGN